MHLSRRKLLFVALLPGSQSHVPSSTNVHMALKTVMTCVDILMQKSCYLSTRIHACCCSAGLVSAEFGYIAQSSIASDGSCPALQPITPPVNGLVPASSTEPAEWLLAQMVWLPVSILSCRTGLTRAPMRQLSTHASASSPHPPNLTLYPHSPIYSPGLHPPNCSPGVSVLGQLARAAAAQLHLGLQDSLASCKFASTALVAIPASAVTADLVSASQAEAGGSLQALRQAVADMLAESGAQSVKMRMTVITCCMKCSLVKRWSNTTTSSMSTMEVSNHV